jgi:hypothetical protein
VFMVLITEFFKGYAANLCWLFADSRTHAYIVI